MLSQTAQSTDLTYAGTLIHQRQDMLSLTDMWKAAGADPQQAPAKWRGLPGTKAFVDHVEVTIGKSDSELFLAVNGGRSPGTWAHWQIGLAYAKYLSPEFHMWCNTVVRERMEGRSIPTEISMSSDMRQVLGGIVKAVVNRLFEDRMQPVETALARMSDQVPSLLSGYDPTYAVVTDYKPMLTVLAEQQVGPRKRRQLSQRCSSRCKRWLISRDRGADIRLSRETKRYLFQTAAVSEWLSAEGYTLIAAHREALAGQTVMAFRSRLAPTIDRLDPPEEPGAPA